MNKTKLMQVRDVLSINRVMAKDSDDNYTREVTPKVITDAIAICEAELARVDEPVAQEPVAWRYFVRANGGTGYWQLNHYRSGITGEMPLYATPQEAVSQPGQAVELSDTALLDYLQTTRATIEVLIGIPCEFRVGGLYSSENTDIRAAIIAAINAKGTP